MAVSKPIIQALILSMSVVSAAFSAQPAPQTISLTFGNDSVSVGGVPALHPIYLFGISREPRAYVTRVQPYESRLLDTTGLGIVNFPFKRAASWRSVWLALDLTSGVAVAGAPPEYPVKNIELSGKELKKDAGGEIAQISSEGTMVEFVVVRPGVGVWGETVGSRGPFDEGSEDGKVTLSVFKLQPRGETTEPAPKKLKKGDVVFLLDSFHARYGLATVGD